MTPREEEPQIVVPMVDVLVEFPGHSPAEVEQLVAVPLERLLWQIGGVEHVYSISRRGFSSGRRPFLCRRRPRPCHGQGSRQDRGKSATRTARGYKVAGGSGGD